MTGTDGPPGLIGEPGPEGALGDNEEKGAKIQPEPSGDQGPQGDDGDQGAQGECPVLRCEGRGGGGTPPHGPGCTPSMDESYFFHPPT